MDGDGSAVKESAEQAIVESHKTGTSNSVKLPAKENKQGTAVGEKQREV